MKDDEMTPEEKEYYEIVTAYDERQLSALYDYVFGDADKEEKILEEFQYREKDDQKEMIKVAMEILNEEVEE